MNYSFRKMSSFFMILSFSFVVLLFSGCGGDSTANEEDSDNETEHVSNIDANPIELANLYTPNNGRLLGAQCAQCHGTNGISTTDWDSIAGEDEMDEIFGEHPIMDAQAKGYTQSELIAIGSWLSTLSKNDD